EIGKARIERKVEDFEKEVVFAAHVPVKCCFSHAQPVGNVVHRGAVKTGTVEALRGGPDNGSSLQLRCFREGRYSMAPGGLHSLPITHPAFSGILGMNCSRSCTSLKDI